jgi:AhpD family alkylhydroperoxidase
MNSRLDYAKVSPAGYKAFGDVYALIQGSGLSKELIYLVYLRVSQINGCAYCIDMHSRDLLKFGVAVEKLVLVPVWRDAGAMFSTRERVALAWAESVTRVSESNVPEVDFEFAAAEFNAKELADLHICDQPDERVQSPIDCISYASRGRAQSRECGIARR